MSYTNARYNPDLPPNLPKREDWNPDERGGHTYEEGVMAVKLNLVVANLADECEGFSDAFHEFFDEGDSDALDRWASVAEALLTRFRQLAEEAKS